MLLLRMFRRKWLLPTLLVFVGTAVCIRLGIWQLDRLEGRRTANAHKLAMWALPELNLNQDIPQNLTELEYRAARVTGKYDFENQVAFRNQYHENQRGYHLLTPLLFNGDAVLVDRGWIPAEGNATPADWRKYDEVGVAELTGQIRLGQTKPVFGGVADPLTENGEKLEFWNNLDVARIANQTPYPIMPVFLQLDLDEPDIVLPIISSLPEEELTEGPHLGYALQWFTFATILFVGYPFYLQKQEKDLR